VNIVIYHEYFVKPPNAQPLPVVQIPLDLSETFDNCLLPGASIKSPHEEGFLLIVLIVLFEALIKHTIIPNASEPVWARERKIFEFCQILSKFGVTNV